MHMILFIHLVVPLADFHSPPMFWCEPKSRCHHSSSQHQKHCSSHDRTHHTHAHKHNTLPPPHNTRNRPDTLHYNTVPDGVGQNRRNVRRKIAWICRCVYIMLLVSYSRSFVACFSFMMCSQMYLKTCAQHTYSSSTRIRYAMLGYRMEIADECVRRLTQVEWGCMCFLGMCVAKRQKGKRRNVDVTSRRI